MHRKVARLAVLIALALALSYVERLIPLPMPAPGIKLGLANLVTLVALYLLGWREALCVSVTRVLLGGLMFGSGFSIVYALSGALVSLLAMALLQKSGWFHPIAVSAVSGVVHNLAQLLVAAWVVRTPGLFAYFPLLTLSGLLTGLLIGSLGSILIARLRLASTRE